MKIRNEKLTEQWRKASKKYYKKHSEKAKECAKKWREKNGGNKWFYQKYGKKYLNGEIRGKHKIPLLGVKNPMWQGGKSFEKYTVDWTATLKRSIRERDKYICQICGQIQGNRSLDVHHIDYNKKNCNPENLITLCNKCHTKTNYNREKWIIYFKYKQYVVAQR